MPRDTIKRLREDETIIAKLITDEFAPMFAWLGTEDDDALFAGVLLSETERRIVLAVRSYLEWLAVRALRGQNFNPADLIEMPEADLWIAVAKNGDGLRPQGEAQLLKQTVKWLRWRASDRRLPPLSTALGELRDGQFAPNEAAIRSWARTVS